MSSLRRPRWPSGASWLGIEEVHNDDEDDARHHREASTVPPVWLEGFEDILPNQLDEEEREAGDHGADEKELSAQMLP